MSREFTGIQTIEINPPLPCGAMPEDPKKICGQLTSVAYAVAMPADSILYNVPLPGRWLIQPICEACAKKMEQTHHVQPDN